MRTKHGITAAIAAFAATVAAVPLSVYAALPDGYAQLDWVESDGTAYINTGVVPTQTMQFTFKFQPETQQAWKGAFGSYVDESSLTTRIIFNDTSSTSFRVSHLSRAGGGGVNFDNVVSGLGQPIEGYFNHSYARLNNVEHSLSAVTGTATSAPMKLGRSGGACTSRQKIFYFKITDGSTLLRDFVPARRKSDSAIGFYDQANSVFYENAEASGAFTAGPTAATSWNNQNLNNGDMATEGNWSNGLPSSGVSSVIAYPVSVPLTLSRDMDTGANFYINYPGTSPLDLTLNLGAGRTLSANRTYVGWLGSRATVTLASGTWSVSERFFVGDGWSDATFIVDGANSALYGSTLASGNYYIQVGNAGDGSYATSKNNLLLVRNGGLLQGGVIVGRLAKAENELCGTNTLHVTGDGSRFVSNHSLYIGCKQGLSQGIIDDHATATLSSNVILGQYLYNNGLYYVGDQNRLLVSGGASLTAAGNAYIGHTASASNLFEVADGATATVKNLYSSYASNANVRGGRAPFGNRIVVRGDGSSLTVNGGTSIGYVGGSHDDSMLIADGATFAANTISVGVYDGHSSRLTVDGAALSVQGQMTVGCTVPASNCVFEVLNGATATMQRLVFGDKAPNSSAVISNATLNVGGNLDLGYSGTSSNMTFVVAGRNGKVRASGQVHIFNASAKIVFHVPAEGFAETPLVVGNFENVQQGAAIEVTADERWPGGSCQTLVECANGQEFSWVAMNRLTLVCNDDKLRVVRTADKIYVKKLGGFVITFR